MAASLIIIPKTIEGFLIDVSEGRFEFGISNVNSTEINPNSFQLSNRFDNLVVGRYYWTIKDRITHNTKFTGYNDVFPVDGSSACKSFYVNVIDNLTEIDIPYSFHNKQKVSDVICHEWFNTLNKFEIFFPSEIFIDSALTVKVRVSTPFTGKIEVC